MWLTALGLPMAFMMGWILATIRMDKKAQEQCLECIAMRGIARFAEEEN
ncbi:hypothetical protein CTH_2278 [Carboxydocella thermautotrophica]|nr:hypothetical protein CTH_2278 [Carboxydocella thermautotrophica]